MFENILVAVDGSDHSDAAIATACKLAQLAGSKVHLVHVPQPVVDAIVVAYAAVPVPPSEAEALEAGQKVMDDAKARVAAQGQTAASAVLAMGDPAQVIVETAEKDGADLIVLGRRGLGRLTGLLIGSTSAKVGQLAPCAVLTVK